MIAGFLTACDPATADVGRVGAPPLAPSDSLAGSAQVDGCRGDAQFEMLVADRARNEVLRFDGNTGAYLGVAISSEAGTDVWGAALDRPADVAVAPDGDLYVANFGPGSIVHFDRDGTFVDVLFMDSTVLEEPTSIVMRGDVLWVVGNDSYNMVALSDGGEVLASVGKAELRSPYGAAPGPDGDTLYVTSMRHPGVPGAIQIWDLDEGQLVDSFAADPELGLATGIGFDCEGQLYVGFDNAGPNAPGLQAFTAAPAELGEIDGGDFARRGGIMMSSAIAVRTGPDGRVYLSHEDGVARLERGHLGAQPWIGAEHLSEPRGIAFRPQRRLAEPR